MTQVLRAKHIVGEIALDEHGSIIDHPSRKAVPDVDEATWPSVLKALKNPARFDDFKSKNIELTIQSLKSSVGQDVLIMQAVSAIEELDRSANMVSKRLREWSGWWVPEIGHAVSDHAALARLIAQNDRSALLAQAKEKSEDSMGGELAQPDINAIKVQAGVVLEIMACRDRHESYLKEVMQSVCPNLFALAGALIGAKLVVHAGGIKRLSELPSSTIQLLGAEKALFRHLRTGARPPKFGVIYNHPLVQKSKRSDQGKVARGLSDKISIAVKVDFFKGEFIGDQLKADLERRFRA